MAFNLAPGGNAAGAFLLAFPALFSIVNPIGASLIFSQVTAARTHAERQRLAAWVGMYSLVVLLVSLWLGSYLLNFFGISLGALRVGGGLVVARAAWMLLHAPEAHEARKEQQAQPATRAEDAAFYPLTMPLTTGPGTISVAVALGSERPEGAGLLQFFLGVTGAAAVIALMVWIGFRYADVVLDRLGGSFARILSRLVAFLLLCIGVQILGTGIGDLVTELLHTARG